jgi:SAM-dependent methyltransferase
MTEKKEHFHNWQAYWQTKKNNLDVPLGKHVVKDIVSALTRTFPKDQLKHLRILEVGCGEGHILGWLADTNKEINPANIVGVDKNIDAIASGKIQYPQINFEYRDITDKAWTSMLGHFDIILFVNTLHEVFSSQYDPDIDEINSDKGKSLICEIINQAVGSLAKNGYLLIYDGIEYEGDILNENVIFTLRNKDGERLFEKFCQEYMAYTPSFIQTTYKSKTTYKMNKRDFSRFVTKISLLESTIWSIEKEESYQFANENDLRRTFENNKLHIVYKGMFTSEIDKWNSYIHIEDGVFPFEHAIFVGKKL